MGLNVKLERLNGRFSDQPACDPLAMVCLPMQESRPAKPKRRAWQLGGRITHFENLVFAGGGNRCLWQAGFWSVISHTLDLRPSRVAAVSAGSAIACAIFSGAFDDGFAKFKRAIANNDRNLHLRNLLHRRPIFPHGNIYREAILGFISELNIARLHSGPDIQVLVSRHPKWASPRLALFLGVLATGAEAFHGEQVHSSMGRRIGFRPEFISVRECQTPEALADLIMASSCAPPFTPQARREGLPLLDGALIDNVPTDGVSEAEGETLIMLTRQFRKLPVIPGRTYVQPSQPIPAAALDYTNHHALQATFDLGRSDGERFCASIEWGGGIR